ncbi:MAG: aminotransferase, partial [Bacteroidota bacterium]|nr:aminotransferase [Bacteroidota bacterium]
LLNPDIHFLNFGSFGASPKPVFEDYQRWQRLLEAEPVQFIAFDGLTWLEESRAALASFINCRDKDDLVFVTNPSFAVNLIAKNIPLSAGDEVLSTDIEYGACDRIWDFYCEKSKATYRRQKIRLPIAGKQEFIDNFFEGLNANTKAVFISHITSSTALIFPVKEICEIAKAKGLITIVDGAHAPGHVPLDLKDLKADFYTGACHKWMMAPKGCSFLYASREAQKMLKDPLVISWGYKAFKPSHSAFLDYNQMIGTRDYSAFLTVPACIKFMKENNWPSVSKKCHEMVLANASRFYTLLGSAPLSPLTSDWIGQMISIPIKIEQPEVLQRKLFVDYKVEVPVMRQANDGYFRYSINAFNTMEDLDALYEGLSEIKKQGELIG